MEAEEDDERHRHALDEHPTREAVHLGLDGAGLAVLQLERVDEPHGEVEEHQEVAHVATGHADGLGVLRRQVLVRQVGFRNARSQNLCG